MNSSVKSWSLLGVILSIIMLVVSALPDGINEQDLLAQCNRKTRCPEFTPTVIFDTDTAHMPAPSSVFLEEVSTPLVSPVLPIFVTTVVAKGKGKVSHGDGRYWQLRTLTVFDTNVGTARHFLVPFLISTGHPYVYLSDAVVRLLTEAGLEEHTSSSLALCKAHARLPISGNGTCLRQFTPTKYSDSRDGRKNIIGSVDASAILAVNGLLKGSDAAKLSKEQAMSILMATFENTASAAEVSILRDQLSEEYDLQKKGVEMFSSAAATFNKFITEVEEDLRALATVPEFVATARKHLGKKEQADVEEVVALDVDGNVEKTTEHDRKKSVVEDVPPTPKVEEMKEEVIPEKPKKNEEPKKKKDVIDKFADDDDEGEW